jgi:AAA family ATP:ADP antiporter
MGTSRRLGPLTTAAMGSSAVIMALQVASRATRDTLFLSNYQVSSMPVVIAVASVLSIVVALIATRGMVTLGPARFVPMAFLGSALLTIGEWVLAARQPGLAAIAVYLHVAAIAPVLVSGFWSILNEHFDPRAAKQAIGRIAAAGTLGGLAGGLLVERLAAWNGVIATLPALAVAQAWCAWSIRRMPSAGGTAERPPAEGRLPAREVGRRLLVTPYLRNLALLVLGCSVSNTLLDYVFKAQTFGAVHQAQGLMQVFSAFYAAVAVLTFAIQALFSRLALERAGLAPTIGTLPAGVVVGSVSATLIPGPWSVALARGLEGTLRGSLFRAGYELLYTPVPAAEKRATKTLVDIGCDRIGDIVGAGITAFVLVAAPFTSTPALLGLSALIAAATLWLVAQLQRGYVSSLEAGLRVGALDLDGIEIGDRTTRTILLRTVGGAAPTVAGRRPIRADAGTQGRAPARGVGGATTASDPRPAPVTAPGPESPDPVLERLRALRSGDPRAVRASLLPGGPLDAALVPDAIRLLGWDEVAQESAEALRSVAQRHLGELTDALLDPRVEIAVRRRIPAVLAACATASAVDGLTRGLADGRFEVRYRCGRSLARLLARSPGLVVDRDLIFDAVRREATLGRHVWDSQRLLDRLEKRDEDCFVDEFLRDRAGRSLEHTFTLLSLVLPREPLQIAFRGLHAGDAMLRGTALEYLESVLPPDVRERLWPYLEPERRSRAAPGPPRDREQVLNDLLRSHGSIEVDLEALRRRHDAGSRPEDG